MSFQVVAKTAGKRLGELVMGGKTVRTPSIFVQTQRLCVPHLTPDTFARTLGEADFAGLLVNFEPLLEDGAVIPKTSPLSLAALVGFAGTPTILAVDEPAYHHGSDENMRNGPDHVAVQNTGGIARMHLNDSTKMLIKAMRPDAVLSPSDHYQISSSRLKRIKRSTENTKKYYQLCRDICSELAVPLAPSVTLHSISGESDEKRALVMEEMQRRIETVRSQASSMVAVICDKEPTALLQDLPGAVYVRGPTDPKRLAELAGVGVDLFDTTFATDSATKGVALNISSDGSFTEINLDDPEHFDDFTPLSPDCRCIACHGADKTTRSYIHHLVKTTEMLAGVFLASHNLWQYASLCRSFRDRAASPKGDQP